MTDGTPHTDPPESFQDPDFVELLRDATASNEAAAFAPGYALSELRYELVDLLSRQRSVPCEVWRAWDHWGDRPVVVKTLLLERVQRAATLARFEREIRALARLDHPHIVALLDEGVEPSPFGPCRYFVTEYVEGAPFPGHAATLPQLLRRTDQLLAALGFAHSRGIIHRDLKPHNVWVHGDTVKVLDLGIAHPTMQPGPVPPHTSGDLLGTIAYMSAEQARGLPHSVGPASDLYALGVMLYEALSGVRPFAEHEQGADPWVAVCAAHASAPPPPLRILPRYASAYDEAVCALVHSLLRKRYADRPESAADVRARIAALLAATSPQPAPAPTRPPEAPEASETPDPFDLFDADVMFGLEADTSWRLPFWRDPPPIGHDAERQRLTLWREALLDGTRPSPLVAVIHGAAGSGTSRCARWFAETEAEAGRMRVLRLELSGQRYASAWRNAMYQQLRFPELEHTPLLERIDTTWPDAPDAFKNSLIRALMHPNAHRDAWSDLGWACIEQLTAHPSPRPLLVWFDGVPHNIEALCAWLDTLTQRAPTAAPVCVIWSHTDPDRPPAPHPTPHTEPLPLPPLSDSAQHALAAQLTPGLTAWATERALTFARGNPRFLRELLLAWSSAGYLHPTPEGLELDPEALTQLPTSLDDVVMQRLDAALARHAPAIRDAIADGLATLAFLETQFSDEQANWAFEAAGLTAQDLRTEGWIEALPESRDARYTFTNPLLRDLLVQRAIREGHHLKRRAECVELRLRGQLSALVRSDWHTALNDLHMAWHLLEQASNHAVDPTPRDTDALRARVLAAMAQVHLRQRDPDAVRFEAERIEAYDPASAELWRGVAAQLTRDHARARDHLKRAARAAQGATATAAQAHQLLGQLALIRGDLDAAHDHLSDALDHAQRAQEMTSSRAMVYTLRLIEADTLRDRAECFALQSDIASALEHTTQALLLHRRFGDLQGEAHAFLGLARLRRRQATAAQAAHGHTDATREALDATARDLRRAGVLMARLDDPRGAALVRWEEALLALARERYADAERALGRTTLLFHIARDPRGEALSLNARGEACRRLGDAERAQRCYLAALQILETLEDLPGQGTVLANLGWLGLESDDAQTASAHFHDALSRLRAPSLTQARAAAHIGLAAAHIDQPDALAHHLQRAYDAACPCQDHDALAALRRLNDDPRAAPSAALIALLRGDTDASDGV